MPTKTNIDFENTEIAFERMSDDKLKQTGVLFRFMNNPFLVNTGSKLGMLALKMRLPFVKKAIKYTIFEQFCGGTTFEENQTTVEKLWDYKVLSILDYGVEAKYEESDFDSTMKENIKAIDFSQKNASVPVVVSKISGIIRFDLLAKKQEGIAFSESESAEYERARARVRNICQVAYDKGNVGIFFDAEESWIQDSIDELVMEMMAVFNKERVVIYNTYQFYRHDRLAYMKQCHQEALEGNFMLGAKLVRGAYMDKERARAEEMGYPSPIQADKAATDEDYNTALQYCIDHYKTIASCNATHNQESVQLQADALEQMDLPNNHPHLNFCQLLGMSDHLTFNLAKAGYNVAKYVVYGSVDDVVPYLIRRAQENSTVTGDMSREYGHILKEMKRRGLK